MFNCVTLVLFRRRNRKATKAMISAKPATPPTALPTTTEVFASGTVFSTGGALVEDDTDPERHSSAREHVVPVELVNKRWADIGVVIDVVMPAENTVEVNEDAE